MAIEVRELRADDGSLYEISLYLTDRDGDGMRIDVMEDGTLYFHSKGLKQDTYTSSEDMIVLLESILTMRQRLASRVTT